MVLITDTRDHGAKLFLRFGCIGGVSKDKSHCTSPSLPPAGQSRSLLKDIAMSQLVELGKALESLQGLFPMIERDVINLIFEEAGHDLQRAIGYLTELQSAQTDPYEVRFSNRISNIFSVLCLSITHSVVYQILCDRYHRKQAQARLLVSQEIINRTLSPPSV